MRLALQAIFAFGDTTPSNDELREKREKIERELRRDEKSARFFQRLRAAMARRDLNAPEVFAEESFPDANIVAEYLDCNEKSSEIAADYERVCWESPEILAEVGCCFDLLTNNWARASEPPLICRRRLYYIPWEDVAARANDSESERRSATRRSESVVEERVLPIQGTINIDGLGEIDENQDDASRSRKSQNVRRESSKSTPGTDENEIARTLKAGRRAKSRRWTTAACVLSGVASLICFSLIDFGSADKDKATAPPLARNKSLAFPNESSVADAVVLEEEGANVDRLVPAPLRPSTISFAEASKTEEGESKKFESLGTFRDENWTRLDETSLATVGSEIGTKLDASNGVLKIAAAPKESGLDSSSHFNKRPSFVIPDKNNDVFSRVERF